MNILCFFGIHAPMTTLVLEYAEADLKAICTKFTPEVLLITYCSRCRRVYDPNLRWTGRKMKTLKELFDGEETSRSRSSRLRQRTSSSHFLMSSAPLWTGRAPKRPRDQYKELPPGMVWCQGCDARGGNCARCNGQGYIPGQTYLE